MLAWLFDVYPNPSGVTIWFIDQNGGRTRAFRPFIPSFILHLNEMDRRRLPAILARCPVQVSTQTVQRIELYSGETWNVQQIFVHDPTRFKAVVWYFEKFFPHFAFYNSDIPVQQLFLYETQLFPLARGEYEIANNGELRQWTLLDSRAEVEYELPPLAIMHLRASNDFVPPKYRRHLELEISYDGRTYVLQQETSRGLLESFNWHLHRCDPDILLTNYGDSILLPMLTDLARQQHFPLLLNRDQETGYTTSKGSSFFQYGKIVHKDGAFELAGRWHVDQDNSVTVAEADLDGLFEMVRLTQMCGQRQGRASIGTSMSSMQLSWACRNNVLIPAKKREPEEFKSAATLLLADRGGLIFNPPLGYHEDVAELDFVSMYPTIMVQQNVSPETVNCRCCKNARVPELGYTICEKRRGIVPETLQLAVQKRAYYKKKKKEFKGKDNALFKRYDRRQNALKWMLVSCFGYLGYKNARFGRIEAHEAVNAFSRDAILTAKEIAERQGYRMLHGIIDCVWLKKEGARARDFEQLAQDIGRIVGIDVSLEGIYDWICFPASKTDPAITTANRYVGWYRHGEYKMRGIEARRRDTPQFIKELQIALLDRMSKAHSINELHALVPEILDCARTYVQRLQRGQVNPMELVLKRHIRHEAGEYTTNCISAVVARMVDGMGVPLAAGESIEFIIVDQSGKRTPEKAKPLALYAFEDGYDIAQYTEFALRAIETLLLPFGYDKGRLRHELRLTDKKRQPHAAKRRPGDIRELPLFSDRGLNSI